MQDLLDEEEKKATSIMLAYENLFSSLGGIGWKR